MAGLNPDQNRVLQELNLAAQSGASLSDIAHAMSLMFQSDLSPEYVPALIAILPRKDHQHHEDIVRTFQTLRDPRTERAIYETALAEHDYLLSYDEFFGLARKCTWALADIGTPTARAHLEILAHHKNPQIAGYAQERLDRWHVEQHRKGA